MALYMISISGDSK